LHIQYKYQDGTGTLPEKMKNKWGLPVLGAVLIFLLSLLLFFFFFLWLRTDVNITVQKGTNLF